MALSTGAQFGSYVIRRPLGSGGMGVVYEAFDIKLQRPVALKVLQEADSDPARSSTQLVREARAAAALNHPNVCTIYEVGEIDGTPFIAMELIEGQMLQAQAVVAQGALAPARVCRLGRQLADALGRAHAAGVIHRDRLERAVPRRELIAFSLRDPRFDPIASSSRFKQILKTMNLPDWPEDSITGRGLIALLAAQRTKDRIEAVTEGDQPPEDKWEGR